MKRAELAVRLGVDPVTVYRWETGRSPLSDDRKDELAAIFAVSKSHLMGWDEDENGGNGIRRVA